MRKALRWLAVIVGGLALLLIALYGFARLRGLDDEQKAAIALLERDPPPPGRNGFALLWLLPHDVPEGERERVLAEDVRRFAKTPPPGSSEAYESFNSFAEEHYPTPPDTPGRERYCTWRDQDCLAKVRAQPQAYVQLLEADAALISRADSLSAYDHVRTMFPPRLDAPLPAYRPLAYPMSRHALAFASGEVETGLAGACRGVSAGRMLIRSGDNLITSLIGAAMIEGNAALLADMLAELPADHPLPPTCTLAFAPSTADEFSLCNTMRGESRFMFATLRHMNEWELSSGRSWKTWFLPVTYNPDKTIAREARQMGWYCGAQARAALAADLPLASAPPSRGHPLECIDNYVGCVLSDTARPSFGDYQRRLQDAAIRLKTTATLLWLRDRPKGQSMADRFAKRPAALRSPQREARIGDDDTLSVALYYTPDADRWSLPLPASRRAPTVRTSP